MQRATRRTSPDGIWLRAVANVTALAGLSGVAAVGYVAGAAVNGMSGDDVTPAHVHDGGKRTYLPRTGPGTTPSTRDEDDGTEESGRTSGLSPVQPQKTPNASPKTQNTSPTPNGSVQGGSNGS